MIVKNEAAVLAECLASVRDWVDELVVVDTGSEDETVEIVKSFGAKVFFQKWENDFAAARNASLAQAASDWILVLDADERLQKGEELKKIISQAQSDAYLVKIRDVSLENHQDTIVASCRLFRNDPRYRFRGKIHENTVASILEAGGAVGVASLEVWHVGYNKKRITQMHKRARNLTILESEIRAGKTDPFTLYNLGVEYTRMGDSETALATFQRAFRGLDAATGALAGIIIQRLVACLISLDRKKEALAVLDDAIPCFEDFTDLKFLAAEIRFQQGLLEEAKQGFLACLAQGDSSLLYISLEGTGTWRACNYLGQIFLIEQKLDDASYYFQQALIAIPGCKDSISGLAKCYLPSRLAEFEKIIRKDLDVWDWDSVQHLLGLLEAQSLFELAYSLGKEYARSHKLQEDNVSLGKLALTSNHYQEALGYLTEEVTEPELKIQRQYWLTIYYLSTKDYFEAGKSLQEFARLGAPPGQVALLKTTMEALAGRALSPFALEIGRADFLDALVNYICLPDTSIAEAYTTKVLASLLPERELSIILGLANYRLGQYSQTVKILLSAIDEDCSDVEIINALGESAEHLGYEEEALDFYKRSLEINRDQPQIKLKSVHLLLENKDVSIAMNLLEKTKAQTAR
jgi:tetratricopeptide (TPR) repeat protein